MDIEKLIEQLNDWNENLISELCADDKLTCDDLCDGKDCIVVRAATFLSTLQSENEKLRAEAEGMRSNWYKSVEEIQKLRADLERLGLELEVRKRQEEAMTDIANDFQQQLHAALDELEQVKHQRDSYRLYHDDLASKPNCNTCADKDCKYRPIPGDTVRANCPLWRGPDKEG